MTAALTRDEDVPIPMRDGTVTRADVYRRGPGRRPVLLARGAWSKRLPWQHAALGLDPVLLAERGYAVVVQDVRGTHASEGDFVPFRGEVDDGYDSVDWCAGQPWSNGVVGMFGRSQPGLYAWLGAVSGHPALRAIAPVITTGDSYSWVYRQGVFELGWATWFTITVIRNHLDRIVRGSPDPGRARERLEALHRAQLAALSCIPLGAMPGVAELAPYFEDWLGHPAPGEWWAGSVRDRPWLAAVLLVGGWYDVFADGALREYETVRRATTLGPDGVRLLVGPWAHNDPFRGYLGELSFGPRASGESAGIDAAQLEFFDRWLKGVDAGAAGGPPRRLFRMGDNVWLTAADWEPSAAAVLECFLHSGGRANSLTGDGTLSSAVPGPESPDGFVYDPARPVPTRGGAVAIHGVVPQGPLDQRRIEAREDVLVYTSRALRRPLRVAGRVRLRLWASSSAPDTDFTAKLVDVHPDGRALLVTDGIVRARFRAGTGAERLLEPDEVVEYDVSLGATCIAFQPGHRVRLEISSSNFPRFSRNLNTEARPELAGTFAVARQRVFHDAGRPSALLLPLAPAELRAEPSGA